MGKRGWRVRQRRGEGEVVVTFCSSNEAAKAARQLHGTVISGNSRYIDVYHKGSKDKTSGEPRRVSLKSSSTVNIAVTNI